uniref:proteasome subunit beta type-1 n=1 Tax=Myxine glutinosa TaxID=7769 RepID=UPI00358E3DBB
MDSYLSPVERKFAPYSFNGGTVLSIAGKDYCIIAADSRLSRDASIILSRDVVRSHQLTNKTFLGICGFHGDSLSLVKIVKTRLKVYEHDNGKQMPTIGVAAMLATILYGRRFFPFYCHCIVCGLDENGMGVMCDYDAIGSYSRSAYGVVGTGTALIRPLLDDVISHTNTDLEMTVSISLDEALQILHDVANAAAERDVCIGDSFLIHIITKNGVKEEKFTLRRD